MTEDASTTEKAREFLGHIKDWNLMGHLPEGFPLPDGKSVKRQDRMGFYDHGSEFSVEGNTYGQIIQGVEEAHKGAEIVTIFPYQGECIFRYHFRSPVKDESNRSAIVPFHVELLMALDKAKALMQKASQDPSILEDLVNLKFPGLLNERQKINREELIYLPHDVNHADYQQRMRVLST